MTKQIDPKLEQRFSKASNLVAKMLPPKPDEETGREILARYAAAIEPNFIAWVGAGIVSARSLQARYAASENLYEEIQGDHQGMLHRFASGSHALPTIDDYAMVQPAVTRMRGKISRMNGLFNIGVLAYLENTSAQFIPYLTALASRLGCADFTYTDSHGEADIEHSKQLLWALGYEMQQHSCAQGILNDAIFESSEFLRKIFNPETKK